MVKLRTLFSKRFEISEQRLEICRSCEYLLERFDQCDKCGCFMNAKTLFMDSECPIGKWGPVKLNNEEDLKEFD
jgi:hypothetical protein